MSLDDDPDDHELDESYGSFDDRIARAQRRRTRDLWLPVVTLAVVAVATLSLIFVFEG